MSTIAAPHSRSRGVLRAVIAQARHRMRARRIRIALLLLIVLAACGVTVASLVPIGRSGPAETTDEQTTPAIAHLATLPGISEIGVVAPGEGWAASGAGLFFTEDDGARWRILSVPGLSGPAVANLGAFASHGTSELWIATGQKVYGTCGYPVMPSRAHPANSVYEIAHVQHSTDGGRTWTTSSLPGCGWVSELSFPSVSDGVALEDTSYPNGGTLFTTTDAGKTWRRVGPTPFQGPLDFTSAKDGWGVSTQAASSPEKLTTSPGVLYRTSNGGLSWQRSAICSGALARPIALICGTPTFFNANDGVVPAVVVDHVADADRVVVFSTRNGGQSWSERTVPEDAAVADYLEKGSPTGPVNADLRFEVPFSAPSASDWFVYVGPRLYRTDNGGRTWSTITPRPTWSAPSISSMIFSTANSGWIVADWEDGYSETPPAVFDRTTDGGLTWKPIADVKAEATTSLKG